MGRRVSVALAVIATIGAWAAVIARLPVSGDEAYYAWLSQRASWTYPDHPPLCMWLVAAGRALWDGVWGVRLAACLTAVAAAGVGYRLAREVGARTGLALWSALCAAWLPAPAAGAVIMTPDVPLGFFWTAFALVAVRQVRRPSVGGVYAAVVLCALAVLSKASGLLLVPVAAWLWWRRTVGNRRPLHAVLSALVGLGVLAPWLWAEWQRGGGSLLFQAGHLAGNLPGDAVRWWERPGWIAAMAAAQVGLLAPLGAARPWRMRWRAMSGDLRVLAYLVVAPMLATGAAALGTRPQVNWACTGHLVAPVLVLAAAGWKQRDVVRCALVSGVLAAVVYAHGVWGVLPLPPHRDPVTRLRGWDQWRAVESALHEADCVVADNYAAAALVWWHTGRRTCVASFDRDPWVPRAGSWVVIDEEGDYGQRRPAVGAGAARGKRAWCRTLRPLPTVVQRFGEYPVRTVSAWWGSGCRVAPPDTR